MHEGEATPQLIFLSVYDVVHNYQTTSITDKIWVHVSYIIQWMMV